MFYRYKYTLKLYNTLHSLLDRQDQDWINWIFCDSVIWINAFVFQLGQRAPSIRATLCQSCQKHFSYLFFFSSGDTLL